VGPRAGLNMRVSRKIPSPYWDSNPLSSSPQPSGHFKVMPSYPMGTGGSFPGVKRPDREADHSPPSSAEVKECVAITPLPNPSSWRGG
jgi:hypothetical protein